MTAFLLAHLSDPHLAPLPRPRLSDLIGKRGIGYINWRRNRHLVHHRDVLDALVADLKRQQPDHIAVTGDLVNIALPEEITRAAHWICTLGAPTDVTLVPGNHDAYVQRAVPQVMSAWADFMRGDNDTSTTEVFPFVRRRGPLTLIGVSTAVPTAPFMATGRLGNAQLVALERILRQLEDEPSCRVLLIHHPLRSSKQRRHARLTDSDQLLDVLRRHRVDLVLHGHDHRHAVTWIDGPATRIPIVGVPSASIAHSSIAYGSHREAAAYNLFAIERHDSHWHIAMTTRGFTRADTIAELRVEILR